MTFKFKKSATRLAAGKRLVAAIGQPHAPSPGPIRAPGPVTDAERDALERSPRHRRPPPKKPRARVISDDAGHMKPRKMTAGDSRILRGLALLIREKQKAVLIGDLKSEIRRMKAEILFRLRVEHGEPKGYAWDDVRVVFTPRADAGDNVPPTVTVV